ncbi:MAG: aconitase X swivel domain-containing protein [Ignavibacteriales bacterium]
MSNPTTVGDPGNPAPRTLNIRAQAVIPGQASGCALVARLPLSFWGGFDAATGRVIDVRHDLYGQCVTGKVLFMPGGRGSSSSSGIILEAIRRGTAPAAIVSLKAEAILAIGSIIGKELYGRWVPVFVAAGDDYDSVRTGDHVTLVQSSDVKPVVPGVRAGAWDD